MFSADRCSCLDVMSTTCVVFGGIYMETSPIFTSYVSLVFPFFVLFFVLWGLSLNVGQLKKHLLEGGVGTVGVMTERNSSSNASNFPLLG